MNADADIQVWLERFSQTPPGIVVPYVRTAHDTTLRYRVLVVQEGHTGRSLISQAGMVQTQASVPAALGRISVSHEPKDKCHIDVILSERGASDLNYRFPCRHSAHNQKTNYFKK